MAEESSDLLKTQQLQARVALRSKNLAAFVSRQVKTSLTQDQFTSLSKELLSLKLEKYISEVVTSISEAKFKKSSDVFAAAEICSLLHQRYAEFTPLIVSTLVKQLAPAAPPVSGLSAEQKEKDDADRIARQKNSLRLLCELYLVGIAQDTPHAKESLITQILKDLLIPDREKLVNLQLALVFAKFLADPFILKENDVECELVTMPVRESTTSIITEYYKAISKKLVKEHQRVRMIEHTNQEHLMRDGKIHETKQERLEKATKTYEKLFSVAQTISEILNIPMAELREEEGVTRISSIGISDGNKDKDDKESNANNIWEDEESRSFYEDIFDLKSWVPPILIDKEKDNSGEPPSPLTVEDTEPGKSTEIEIIEGDTKKKSSTNAKLDALLTRLPNAMNRDAIDQIAKDFSYLNSKNSRKKLVTTLLAVPRSRLDLIPHYSRLIATINQIQPDLGTTVVDELEREFHSRQKKKDQFYLEEKTKNIRFIGELTKFQVTPLPKIFHCLNVLLEEFSHHNIDLTCSLLETCGRYLFKRPDTNVRTSNMLDCNPPDRPANVMKDYSPIELYVRKLVYFDLSKKNVEKCLKQIRKLNWED
ncbi:hypothetical protein HK096_006863, partial [Nowakowskiella sp. JEL0078]